AGIRQVGSAAGNGGSRCCRGRLERPPPLASIDSTVPDGAVPSPMRRSAVIDSDLMFRPATELAAMVRSGEVSSRELVEISLARIEQRNPQLNAFVEIDGERALATADEINAGGPRP